MENLNYAYAQVLDVIGNMDLKYKNMIPKKLMTLFEENADVRYKKHIYSKEDLKDYKLNTSAINILALLNLKYWTTDEKHKKELLNNYRKNSLERKERLKIHKVKSIDEMFANRKRKR